MGLDMYLAKKTYVRNWDHMEPEEQHTITIEGPQASHIKPERISYIQEEVLYWRKANAIHKWFVEHVQDGVDNCGTYYVSRETLQELYNTVATVLELIETEIRDKVVTGGYTLTSNENGELVKTDHTKDNVRVITNPEVCERHLPSSSGFFFGPTEYNEWYIQDLEYTLEKLGEILQEDQSKYGHDYEYKSSW